MTTEITQIGAPVFTNDLIATNMPFFDGQTLVFCQSTGTINTEIRCTGTIWKSVRRNKALAEKFKDLPRSREIIYRPWKLAYCDWQDKAVHSIKTGLPENVIERSPSFYRQDGRIHLSFIAGLPTSAGFFYRLYSSSGPDLANMEAPKLVLKSPLFFGFVSPHHICWGSGNVIQVREKATEHTFKLKTSFFRVASVNFRADDPAKFVITGLVDREYNCKTIVYDLSTGSASDVSVGGPAYKATMYGDHLIFAQRQKGSFENRSLHHGDVALSPSSIEISKGE
jgi:hypothetical protein